MARRKRRGKGGAVTAGGYVQRVRELSGESAEWRAKNGPVTVRKVDPATLRRPSGPSA